MLAGVSSCLLATLPQGNGTVLLTLCLIAECLSVFEESRRTRGGEEGSSKTNIVSFNMVKKTVSHFGDNTLPVVCASRVKWNLLMPVCNLKTQLFSFFWLHFIGGKGCVCRRVFTVASPLSWNSNFDTKVGNLNLYTFRPVFLLSSQREL